MKIALLGDIALFGNMSISKNKEWKAYFSKVKEVLDGMDYVVGNLETPFSIKKKINGAKSAYICSDVENVEVLKYLHINAVTLANNHIFDYGKEGYETTKRLLKKNQIEWFGAEGKEVLIEKDDNLIAFLGFCCYSSNPLQCVSYCHYGVNEFDLMKAKERIWETSNKGYFPIVAVHAGVEHVNYPSIDTVKAARMLSEICPMVYYGHHPHVVQGIEEKEQSLIAYSLGNFCFDDVYTSASKEPLITLSDNNRSSCILVIELESNRIVSWNTIPVFIGKEFVEIGRGATIEKIKEYSQAISQMTKTEYETMRNGLISDYISKRKQNRNLMWYLKRLKPRYYFILKNAKYNSKNYNRCVSQYL